MPIVVLIAFLLMSLSARAQEGPLRDSRRLIAPESESVVRVTGARVMQADYHVLREDFAELRTMSEAEIDALLVEKTAFLSRPQVAQEDVNTKISTSRERTRALRPRGYGRALVYPFLDGLIDVKGSGSRTLPKQVSHGNGLMELGESLREYLFENLTRRILTHAGYAPGTVRTYGVIDLGFDVVRADGSTAPAGLVLRQAHERANPTGNFTGRPGETIESLLRIYGVISNFEAMSYGYQTIDRHNMQGSKNGSVVDFGSFLVIRSLVQSTSNPDPALRLPFETWGYTDAHGADPTRDKIRLAADEVARAWRDGRTGRAEVSSFVTGLLSPLEAKYPARPGFACHRLFQ